MSIIIPLIYSHNGEQVQRATVPVGYSLPTCDQFIEKMIGEVLIHIRLFPDRLPQFDKVISILPSYGEVSFSGEVFEPIKSFSKLLRETGDVGAVRKLALDHLDALGQLDRANYSPKDQKDYQDALLVTSCFISQLRED